MNKLYTTLILIVVSLSAFSQDLEGVFQDEDNVIKFENGKIYFTMEEMGSPMCRKTGEGTYQQAGDFLIVQTGDYTGQKSSVESVTGARKDTITVKVVDNEGFAMQGVLVEWLTSSGKMLQGGVTNSEGKALFLHHPKAVKIKVFNMGYNNIAFNYAPRHDYVVTLIKNEIVENKTVVFRFKKTDDEIASVLLLSGDFNPGKDRQKALDKLDKNAQKKNFIAKRMKKEFVPYSR